ncbi:MAG: hypothetical protein H6698_04810 [Myxococcales bacterium]|nr:hypothetical protein [Myxococcales bacterium]MCB9533622.1 hypothetical protein [Myxococcales bacterium]
MSVAHDGDTLYTLSGDGVVIRWVGGAPTAWVRADQARGLAWSGDTLHAFAPTKALGFAADDLARGDVTALDGWAPCRGAESAWYWTDSPATLRYVSPDGTVEVETETVPTGEAFCTTAPDGAALAWFDGIDALAVVTTGERLTASWWADAPPRALRGADGWRISSVDEAVAFGFRSCDRSDDAGGLALCGDVSADEVRPLVRPPPRPAIAAVADDDRIVIADATGWYALFSDGDDPVALRFQATRVYAVFDGPDAVVLACVGGPESSVVAFDALRGTPVATHPVTACPARARSTPSGATLEAGDETVRFDAETTRLEVGGTAGRAVIQAHRVFSAACGGNATIVERVAATREALTAPLCGEVSVADVTRGDDVVAFAVCATDHPTLVFGLDGRSLGARPELSCATSPIRLDAPTASAALYDRAGFRVAATDSGARVDSPTGGFSIVTSGDDVLLVGESWLWATEGVWDRVFWRVDDGPVLALTDAQTESVWRPRGLVSTLRGAPLIAPAATRR